MAWGTTTLNTVWNLVAPRASDASRISRGMARSASSVATITTGRVKHRQGQRRPDQRRLAEHLLAAEERLVDAGAHELDEEAQTEQPEHDRGHAGQVGDRDPDRARDRRYGRGVFVQVDRGGHAHRHDRDGHQHHQRHRAEDGREDPARGHAVSGRLRQKVHDRCGVPLG